MPERACAGCESAPERALLVNVHGTSNVLAAAIAAEVPLVIGISSDKAAYPISVYGSTKLLGERLFRAAGEDRPGRRFVCVRLCNVAGSRGGIIAKLSAAATSSDVHLTHPDMTRFFMSTQDVSQLIGDCAVTGMSGEIYVPRARSIRIEELFEVFLGQPAFQSSAARQNERSFEWLISGEDYILRTEPTYFVVSSQPTARARPAGEQALFRSDSELNLMNREDIHAFFLRCGISVRSSGQSTMSFVL